MNATGDVLIVAKTHAYGGACVGGLDLTCGRSVRLLRSGHRMQRIDTRYEVGQIWTLTYNVCKELVAPHLEDVEVLRGTLKQECPDCRAMVLEREKVCTGSPDDLYDGQLDVTTAGRGFLSRRMEIPQYSVQFWCPECALRLDEDEHGQNYYTYTGRSRVAELRYVGFARPMQVIPDHALVRVSLATWWRPDGSRIEERCYLQLSGWF